MCKGAGIAQCSHNESMIVYKPSKNHQGGWQINDTVTYVTVTSTNKTNKTYVFTNVT